MMPGRLFLTSDKAQICRAMGGTATFPEDYSTGLDIAPGAYVLTQDDQGEFKSMRWGMIMSGRVNARGRPVMETIVNARSETVFEKSAFEGTRRAVVPCDGWYEWTGKKGHKTRWQIKRKTGEMIFFAAIWYEWSGPGGIKVPQVATITCEPNADVRDIHHRMGAILTMDQIKPWLDNEDVPLQPLPDGQLLVGKAPERA